MMSMNSNKRKGRMNPNNNKLGRSKFYSEKNMSCDGIYGNSKVMYAGASLVGCIVQVQVQNGTVYEGVLRTFSHQLDIVLETAHKVNVRCPPTKGVSPTVSNLIASFPFEGGIHDKIIFKLTDIVMMQACNVDVDYAIKDNFTDTAISKFNGQVKERELEPWEGAGSDSETPLMLTMDDDDGTNGWDANDMFRTNAEKYGVKSSYDNSLQEYTVPLTKKDTEEYKLQEAKALKIAQEIETNSSYQSHIQLENGDEEDRFSAVVRTHEESTSKYVLPQKRRNVPGLKRQSSTSSSSPVHLGKSSYPVTTVQSSIPGQKHHPVVDRPFPVTSSKNGTMEKNDEVNVITETSHLPSEPAVSNSASMVSSKMPVAVSSAPAPPTLPPRIERRRENEKKLAKHKGRMDEIEDFKKFSKNFNVLTEEAKEPAETEEEPKASATDTLVVKLEYLKVEKEEDAKSLNVVKFSTLNPNAKEFVFNPNAKSFTPRSVPSVPHSLPVVQSAPTPPSRLPEQQQQAPLMLPQGALFTAMAPQYVVQAPVSVALTTGHFATQPNTTVVPQSNRFRKAGGQALLAPPPSQLTVQYASPPGVLHASQPPQPQVGYPQMNFVVGPRVVSPQPVGVIPTSYCDTSHHLPTHLIMSAQQQGHQHSNHHHHHHHHHHHPPQSQTPVIHPAPSPVHSAHSQQAPPPPPPQATPMYTGGSAAIQLQSMGQHHPLHHHAQHHHQHHFHPGGGAQQVVLMQQPQPQHALHHHHHHPAFHHGPQNGAGGGAHLLSQMAILPTSAAMTTAPASIATPPYVQQHP